MDELVLQGEEEASRGYKYSKGIGKLIVAALLERQMQLRLNDRPSLSQAHEICCGHLKLVLFQSPPYFVDHHVSQMDMHMQKTSFFPLGGLSLTAQ